MTHKQIYLDNNLLKLIEPVIAENFNIYYYFYK